MKALLILAHVFVILGACSTPAVLTPPVGKGTDYPCGDYTSHPCGDGTCCYCEKCFCNQYGGCTSSAQPGAMQGPVGTLRRTKP